MNPHKTGFVLGKFCPLHKGHQYLIDTALSHVERLYIVVDNIMDDVIPVKQRMAWVQAEYPQAIILTQPTPLPQDPSETPEFWDIWREALLSLIPVKVDVVFASEAYGYRLAEELQAEFVMVDMERTHVPISASSIRRGMMENWQYLSDAAKKDMVTTICVFGPESTGKSTLTRLLAKHYDAPFVDEYAETVIRQKHGHITFDDMETIVVGHHECIAKALSTLPPVLFIDTDAIASKIWSQELFGKESELIEHYIARQHFTHYLLLDVDLPWQDDVHRYRPNEREDFFNRCEEQLIRLHKHYTIVRGEGEKRMANAIRVVDSILKVSSNEKN